VKKIHVLAAMATAVVLSSAVWAQQFPPAGAPARPAAAPVRTAAPSPGVAVIDIQYIFKNYALHKAQRDQMKKDFEAVNAKMKADGAQLKQLAESLKQYRPGTPDYKAIEERVVKGEADLKFRMRQEQQNFAEREAKMIFHTYTTIQQEVQRYCQATGTAMVMQCDREPASADRPNDIVRLLNRQVVYFHGGMDISQQILNVLNSRANHSAQRPGVLPR